jgi:phenylpropionate dioxygenase-like ring-hydroxylating dioxygenase large terminal subunit
MNVVPHKTRSRTSAARGGSDWPPSWNTLADGVNVGRYIDPAFQKLEYQKLWSKVWQIAARVDEVPEPGDYSVYEIGNQSVVVVRVDANTIKAYHNVCPHRGTALASGCGRFGHGRIICPFHGWRWDLSGRNQYILEQHEFHGGELHNADVNLFELKTEVLAGFVFINFDPQPQPFDAFIAPIRPLLEALSLDLMHHYWWKSIPIPANWKVAQEAFFDAYHVPATHPQLERAAAKFIFGDQSEGEVPFSHRNVDYQVYANGHGRFFASKSVMNGSPQSGDGAPAPGADVDPVETMAARLSLLVEGMDAQVLQGDIDVLRSLRGKELEAGSSLGGEYVKALYATAAAEQRPMPKPIPEALGMWGGELFIFPNMMILPQGGNAMMYRVRPDGDDPNKCVFEILSTRSYPAATPLPRATMQRVTDLGDPEQVRLIPRQDLGNIPRIQKGLHASAMHRVWLASHHEKMILNMHQELDRYLRD